MGDYTEKNLQIMNGNATCNRQIITLSFDKSWFGFDKYIDGKYYQYPYNSELYQKSIPKGRWDHDDIYLYLHKGAYYVIKMSKSYPHVIAQQTNDPNIWLIAIKNRLRIIGRKVPRYARKTAKNIKKAGIAVGKGIYSFSGHIVNEIAEGVLGSGITPPNNQNPAETKSNIGAAHTVEDQIGGGIVTRYTKKDNDTEYGKNALNARQDAIESFMKLDINKTSYDEDNSAIYIIDEFEEYTATSTTDNCSFKFTKKQDGGKLNRRTMRRHKKTHKKKQSHNRKTK